MGHTSWLGWSESGFEFGGWDSQASALTLPALHVGNIQFWPTLLQREGEACPTPKKGVWGSTACSSCHSILFSVC